MKPNPPVTNNFNVKLAFFVSKMLYDFLLILQLFYRKENSHVRLLKYATILY